MSKRVVAFYNKQFETNVSYLSSTQTLALVEKLELQSSFPYESFVYGDVFSKQPKVVTDFFNSHLGEINLEAKDVIPGMLEGIYKNNIKGKKFAWRDISLDHVFTALSIDGKTDTGFLFEVWSPESAFLWKQSEETQKSVQDALEKQKIGDAEDVQATDSQSNQLSEDE